MARSSTSTVLDVSADAVFAALTDIGRLPEWNKVITRVLEEPPALVVGSEWVVEMHALGQRWPSRSRVERIDRGERWFGYRSCTDDGNPSYATWVWHVADDPAGCRVELSWDLRPATFWRRVLLGRIRARQLKNEVPESLRNLREAAARRPSSSSENQPHGG